MELAVYVSSRNFDPTMPKDPAQYVPVYVWRSIHGFPRGYATGTHRDQMKVFARMSARPLPALCAAAVCVGLSRRRRKASPIGRRPRCRSHWRHFQCDELPLPMSDSWASTMYTPPQKRT